MFQIEADGLLEEKDPPTRIDILREVAISVAEELGVHINVEIVPVERKASVTSSVTLTISNQVRASIFRKAIDDAIEMKDQVGIARYRRALKEVEDIIDNTK